MKTKVHDRPFPRITHIYRRLILFSIQITDRNEKLLTNQRSIKTKKRWFFWGYVRNNNLCEKIDNFTLFIDDLIMSMNAARQTPKKIIKTKPKPKPKVKPHAQTHTHALKLR